MIYPMVLFPVTLSDTEPRFQGHCVIFMHINALSVLCAQLTRDLLAIAKFLFVSLLVTPQSATDDLYFSTAGIK